VSDGVTGAAAGRVTVEGVAYAAET
jgi:hypothetical protein